MTPETLWDRYAAIWSSDAETRRGELVACLADDATYCDPNGLKAGRAALSEYMGGFQQRIPGGRFRILQVLHHNDRSLAHWRLEGAGGAVLQNGTSFGLLAGDGRLLAISGFFYQAGAGRPS
jgi:hypothetical protein